MLAFVCCRMEIWPVSAILCLKIVQWASLLTKRHQIHDADKMKKQSEKCYAAERT